mmetsp:Transcript_110710/g.319798  ORF Transcript_110710/g.319798 Transcript_110710/m.319798 type:complete len:235 (+) Transcript_110710:1348-2052(+)
MSFVCGPGPAPGRKSCTIKMRAGAPSRFKIGISTLATAASRSSSNVHGTRTTVFCAAAVLITSESSIGETGGRDDGSTEAGAAQAMMGAPGTPSAEPAAPTGAAPAPDGAFDTRGSDAEHGAAVAALSIMAAVLSPVCAGSPSGTPCDFRRSSSNFFFLAYSSCVSGASTPDGLPGHEWRTQTAQRSVSSWLPITFNTKSSTTSRATAICGVSGVFTQLPYTIAEKALRRPGLH